MSLMRRTAQGIWPGTSQLFDTWSQELTFSLTAQFKHLGSTIFDRPELDVPEQQLALAYTIDYDLDNFAAAVGFARQTVYSLTQEPGTSNY